MSKFTRQLVILWERELYEYSMNMEKMKRVLSKCPDFEAETCSFEEEVAERGHIPILSPKGHPELAGVGIEYCWGKSKLYFRHNNSLKSGSFSERIKDSICTKNVLFLERVRKFARKARSYGRACANPESPRSSEGVGKLVKMHKSHRCSLNQDLSFINHS